jgi:hypothetical protein
LIFELVLEFVSMILLKFSFHDKVSWQGVDLPVFLEVSLVVVLLLVLSLVIFSLFTFVVSLVVVSLNFVSVDLFASFLFVVLVDVSGLRVSVVVVLLPLVPELVF